MEKIVFRLAFIFQILSALNFQKLPNNIRQILLFHKNKENLIYRQLQKLKIYQVQIKETKLF